MELTTTRLRVLGPEHPAAKRVLTQDALAFLAELHERFDARRRALLAARRVRAGQRRTPSLLEETRHVREDPDWKVAPAPAPLQDRRVEITGPTEAKTMINALNSGAKVFMADFEDSHAPTWAATLQGQANLIDAVSGRLQHFDPKKQKHYVIEGDPAVLVVRPRGLHLDEHHIETPNAALSAAFFDFGLAALHNAKAQLANGQGPYFYLPKLESHLEARLWRDVFAYTEDRLGLERGTIKATVLIETLPAAFEMEEILYELRDHAVGLNAGRWDYIFSCIKTFAHDPRRVLPDRGMVTMEAPFMQAYVQRLIDVCHRRGAHAMGGMSAYIPSRKDPEANAKALAAVRADKQREVAQGHDGTWVAHPDLVALALEVFDEGLDGRPHQLDRIPEDVPDAEALLDLELPDACITEAGLRANIGIALRYLTAWLEGRGAVGLDDLMEDAATAEISRGQIWHWRHHAARLDDGRVVTRELVQSMLESASDALAAEMQGAPVRPAYRLLHEAIHADALPDFLTVPAYRHLTAETAV